MANPLEALVVSDDDLAERVKIAEAQAKTARARVREVETLLRQRHRTVYNKGYQAGYHAGQRSKGWKEGFTPEVKAMEVDGPERLLRLALAGAEERADHYWTRLQECRASQRR